MLTRNKTSIFSHVQFLFRNFFMTVQLADDYYYGCSVCEHSVLTSVSIQVKPFLAISLAFRC